MKLTLLERLEARFRLLEEEGAGLDWKSPEALHQQRDAREPGPAYYALMATAGPATDNPVWVDDWPSPRLPRYQECLEATGGKVFRKGSPAPRWTHSELHQAMAPQIRKWAAAELRRMGGGHGSRVDPNTVNDLAMNMHTVYQSMLAQEKDEGRALGDEGTKGHVSWVAKTVSMAGAKGAGGTTADRVARGRASQLAGPGFSATWDSPPGNKGHVRTPEQAREIADKVAPEFRRTTHTSFDGTPIGVNKKDPGNPYGRWSPLIHGLATELADALESGDREAVRAIHSRAEQLYRRIEDAEENTQGTHNAKRIITTQSGARKGSEQEKERNQFIKGVRISSISGARKEDGGDVDIAGSGDIGDMSHLRHLSDLDTETIYDVLKLGRTTRPEDLRHPSLAGRGLQPLSDTDLRYLIRQLASWLPNGNYPGKGIPGKDVEAPNGEPSPWVKAGQPPIWDKDDVLADIRSSGGEGEGGEGMEELLQKIPDPTQRAVLSLIAQDAAAGKKVNQADVARRVPNKQGGTGISKVMVGKHYEAGCNRLGMTKEQFLDAAKSGGAVGREPGVGNDPLTKFAGWMRLYQDETSVDESKDAIDFEIVWRCARAITELHYHLVVRPLLESGRATHETG